MLQGKGVKRVGKIIINDNFDVSRLPMHDYIVNIMQCNYHNALTFNTDIL